MAEGVIGRNLTFQIKNADGTSFYGLSLKKATYNTVVMSLGDKITGDVYYQDNTLAVTMQEYIEYKQNPNDNSEDAVKFVLVNPPTVVKERMANDNTEQKGMTKYSFEFYHPMYMLGNLPFTDVAVTSNQQKYLSENKTFSWIGTLTDFVAKINKNLRGTQWLVEVGSGVLPSIYNKLSDVLSFDRQTVADALKKAYETWEVPFIIDVIRSGESGYSSGKRFKVQFGLPIQEIIDSEGHAYIFRCGQGVGLKNNSRTPRNNKIVTRIAGYGSETNIQYGYPQIVWTGDQSWDYTINNSPSSANSYPIYDGIVNGQNVRLIKHPFTRTYLMPSIYRETVNKKVNPYATGYDPTIEIKDYYDADNTYDNPIVQDSPSYEIHEFGDIKPELGDDKALVSVEPVSQQEASKDYYTMDSFLSWLEKLSTQTNIGTERAVFHEMYGQIQTASSWSDEASDEQYIFKASFEKDLNYAYVKFESSNINFTATVQYTQTVTPEWDDHMDEDGNYRQSYFKVTIPQLDFDVYACAAVTQEMKINMRSGDCIGCTFDVMVDWDDYKLNFYDEDGNFAPGGSQRDLTKYPNSANGQVTLLLQKDNETFGRLMPNIYQTPEAGDNFVILGIALPQTYVTNAEGRLDEDMKQYMRDNNVYYFDYPLKFDEYFLATNTNILAQMKNNVVVRFKYAGETHALYIKQMSVKFGQAPLPQYDITLTDDVEIVLNEIGQVSSEVSNLKVLLGGGEGVSNNDGRYLRKDVDDTASGIISLIKGLQVGERFVTGLLGEGGVFRKNEDGTTYIEADKLYIRMKAYFDSVEVKHYLHSGGNRIASKAGVNCTRVEFIDSNGNITTDETQAAKFRCYFKAEEDDKAITNDFVVGDLAYCKETNVDVNELDMHSYWRAVVGKSSSASANGEHYIDLSASDCQSGSDIPIAQDDIIQLGNKTDVTRQGAIIEYVGGDDAPSYQIFQGISTYSLQDKNYISLGYSSSTGRAYMNVYGDFYFGDKSVNPSTYIRYNSGNNQLDIKANVTFTSPDPEYGTDNLNAFVGAVTADIRNIQSQIDGQIESWFYDYMPVQETGGAPANRVPLTNKEPYKTWYEADHGGTASEVTTERTKHLGDTFYDNTSGYAFRFSLNTTVTPNVFEWVVIEDSAVIKALADAAKAQDTADHKRRVFVLPVTIGGTTYEYPYPPYDEGDLWVNATYPSNYRGDTDESQHKYRNDLLRCMTSRQSGSFDITEWKLASKYTDNTKLDTFLNGYSGTLTDIQNQIDKKAETWYLNTNPESTWYNPQATPPLDKRSEHVGDLWYCTVDIANTVYKKGTTWFYKKGGTEQNPTYTWEQQNIPQSVFDTIDTKKAIYTGWEDWIVGGINILEDGDLYIPSQDHTEGSGASAVTYKKDNVYKWDESDSEWHETKDQELTDFLNGYSGTLQNYVKTQVDKKAETWVSSSDPSLQWTTNTVREEHEGDMWLNTSNTTVSSIDSMKTAIYTKYVTNSVTTYRWVVDNSIPNSVFDTIDGKKSIYIVWNAWVVNNVNTLQVRDLYIPSSDYTQGTTTYKTNKVYRCTSVGAYNQQGTLTTAPTFQEINYTDDTKFNNFIGTYTGTLAGIQQDISNAATAASTAQSTADSYQYIKDALLQAAQGTTTIDGGLILSTVIALRDYNQSTGTQKVWAGMSGAYKISETGTGYKGHGIAAWYGGGMADWEVYFDSLSSQQQQSETITDAYAKSLFRFDGSGYVAGGNLKWDASGNVTIQGYSINATTLTKGNSPVAAMSDLSSYLPLSAGSTNALTGDLYISNNKFIKWKDSGGTAKTILGLNSSNTLTLGYDMTASGYNTGIYGNTITLGYGTSRTAGLYLNASGNVGIGEASPSTKLHVGGTTSSRLLAITSTSGEDHITFARGSYNYVRATASGGTINFITDGKELAAVNVDLGIRNGAVSVNGTLSVSDLVTASGNVEIPVVTGNQNPYIKIGPIYIGYDGSNLEFYTISNGSHAAANIYARGSVSALGASSGGSGSGITLSSPLSEINSAGLGAPSSNGVALIYSNGWKYSSQSGVNLSVNGGITAAGDITSTTGGFKVTNKNDTHVLLAGGGTMLLSDIGGGSYLPLTGGSLTGSIGFDYDTDSSRAYGINFRNTSKNAIASIYYHNTEQNIILNPIGSVNPWVDVVGKYSLFVGNNKLTYNTYTVWHSGNLTPSEYATASSVTTLQGYFTNGVANSAQKLKNITMASGDDYDTLSGYTAARGSFIAVNDNSITSGITLADLGAYDTLVSFGYLNRTIQFKGAAYSDTLKYRHVYTISTGNYGLSAWKTIAFTDSNVASATKLATKRKLWGNDFDGTEDIGGDITLDKGPGNRQVSITKSGSFIINASTGGWAGGLTVVTNDASSILGQFGYYGNANTLSYMYVGSSYSSPWVTVLPSGNVGINVTSPANKLSVYGDTVLKYDSYVGALTIHRNQASGYGCAISFKNNSATLGDAGFDGSGAFNVRNASSTSLIWAQSNGNVGIGTTSPGYKLDVTGGALGVLGTEMRWLVSGTDKCINAYTGTNLTAAQIQYNGTNMIQLGNSQGVAKVLLNYGAANSSDNALQMYGYTTSMYQGRSTLAIHINSSGNVGIGTDSISSKLHVSGTTSTQLLAITSTSGEDHITFARGSYNYVRATASGGTINFIAGGKTLAAVNVDLGISSGQVSSCNLLPLAGSTYNLGSSSAYWNNLYIKRIYLASGVYLEYNSTSGSQGVRLVGAGFYSDSYVSALGSNSGSGSSITLQKPLSDINSMGAPTTSNVTMVYNGTSWVYSNGATLKVTSIDASTGTFGGVVSVTGTLNANGGLKGARIAINTDIDTNYRLKVNGNALITSNATVNGSFTVGGFSVIDGTYTPSQGASAATQTKLETTKSYLYLVAVSYINSNKSITTRSDERLKEIVSNVGTSVDQIANAPVFDYRWRENRDGFVYLGTSAQYWQKIFPHAVVKMVDGYLSLDYGATALAAAVMTARKVQNHEQRIAFLEEENERLRNEIETLKAA